MTDSIKNMTGSIASNQNFFPVEAYRQKDDQEIKKNEITDNETLINELAVIGAVGAVVGGAIFIAQQLNKIWIEATKKNLPDEIKSIPNKKNYTTDDIFDVKKVNIVADSKLTKQNKIIYNRVFYTGDSLSEKARFHNTSLFSRFVGAGSLGRFTNALTWTDANDARMANRGIIDSIKKRLPIQSGEEISDALLTMPKEQKPSYNINFQNATVMDGEVISRNYAEGGATAAYTPIMNAALSHADLLRAELLGDNQRLTPEERAKTLTVELFGANDLLTVPDVVRKIISGHKSLSPQTVELIVGARLNHTEEMIKAGYRHIIPITLPDLSQTPRYRKKSLEEQKEASEITRSLNEKLIAGYRELQEKYKDAGVTINVFNLSNVFNDIIKNPELNGFSSKYKLIFVEDFPNRIKRNQILVKDNPEEGKITYQVLDPCGQKRSAEVSYQKLNMKHGEDLAENLEDFLALMYENGHTSKDIFEPLNETKAYQTYLKEKSINDRTPLPSVNTLFFDDVHPSSHLHHIISGELQKFMDKNNYEYISPVTERKLKQASLKKLSLELPVNP